MSSKSPSNDANSPTPIIPTTLIYCVDKSFWKDTVHIEFSVFEHDNTDILELLSVDIDSGTEYERVYFSKRNIMAKIADDVEEFYELNHPGKGAVDDALMGDCVHQKLGEYVVDHIEVVGKFSSKREAMLQVIPMAPDDPEIPIVAVTPSGQSDAKSSRAKRPVSGSAKSRASPGPPHSHSDRKNSRKNSLTEKVVAAFSAAGASKDENEKPHQNPVKRRWQRSVKRVMLQNAVSHVKNLLFSKDEVEARPSSAARNSYKASSPSSPIERAGVSPASPANGLSARNARATFPGPTDAPEFVSSRDDGPAPLKPKAAFSADHKN